jgi:DNA-binding response OmpR family regulator
MLHEEKNAANTSEQHRATLARSAARHILIVEDDEVLGDQLCDLLVKEGYQVSTSRQGEEALEFLTNNHVDLLILDLMLPVMTGWELVERMRADRELAQIPVFVITAFQNLDRAKGLGPVFLKPINVPSLLRGLRLRLGSAR